MNLLIGLGVVLVGLGIVSYVVYTVYGKWTSVRATPASDVPLAKRTAVKATEAYYTLAEQLITNGHLEAADKLRIEIMPCVLDMECPKKDATVEELRELLDEGGEV